MEHATELTRAMPIPTDDDERYSSRYDAFGAKHKAPAEKKLWISVVALAAADAIAPPKSRSEGDLDRRDAIQFCTAASGNWFKQREVICALADIDPDRLRERVLIAIADGRRLTGTGRLLPKNKFDKDKSHSD
jgi:hypothetical protein